MHARRRRASTVALASRPEQALPRHTPAIVSADSQEPTARHVTTNLNKFLVNKNAKIICLTYHCTNK